MSRIVAIGEGPKLAGYALAGVEVIEAFDSGSARHAWEQVGSDVGLVLLTQAAREALPERIDRRNLLWVVLPA